ncbi:hypothetical protein DRJ22_03855 [Candidatus Woesearchaeota archaeon]|nr:MAG: hypothetical protein DRJ22_03855 [Candidatus Woesearchaeota archaeon]
MGKIKYLKEIKAFINKTIVFSISDIKKILQEKKANPSYANLLITNLIKKNEIKRVTRGYYSKYSDPTVLAYCIKPSYIGLETALSIHDLWTQETNVVLLTPKRIRYGLRKILDSNVVVHHLSKKFFFGYEYIDYYDLKIPVSNIEKTFIDWIMYRKPLTKELEENFKKRINKKKLRAYLKKYNKKVNTTIRRIINL